MNIIILQMSKFSLYKLYFHYYFYYLDNQAFHKNSTIFLKETFESLYFKYPSSVSEREKESNI